MTATGRALEKVVGRTRKVAELIKLQLAIGIYHRVEQTRKYPTAKSIDDFFAHNLVVKGQNGVNIPGPTRTLDLGCGPVVRNPFNASESFGIDIREDKLLNISYCDLNLGNLPFEENYFDYVTGFDFFEHVPRVALHEKTRFPFVELIDEIGRVLKDDGLLFSKTPAYPAKEAFQDPTHVNLITEDTFPKYFCGPDPWARKYGFSCRFKLVAQEWHCGWLLTLMMKKR